MLLAALYKLFNFSWLYFTADNLKLRDCADDVWCKCLAGFGVEDYETQLTLALRPVTDAAKLLITRTSQVVIGVVVFVLAVHVASAVLRYYFRLAETRRDSVSGPSNVYVTAHAPAVVVGGESSGVMDNDADSTPTRWSRRPPAAELARGGDFDSAGEGCGVMRALRGPVDGDPGSGEFESAGEDDGDAKAVGSRRPPPPIPCRSSSAQLSLRTARRTSATLTPQSTLDLKYSETNV